MDTFISKFKALPTDKKARALFLVIHELTISARETYLENDCCYKYTQLREYNEFFHRMAGVSKDFFSANSQFANDDEFIKLLYIISKEKSLHEHFVLAIDRIEKWL